MPNNNIPPPRPRLIPIPMPWCVEPDHADICLIAAEIPELRATEVYLHVALLAEGLHASCETPCQSDSTPTEAEPVDPNGVVYISARPAHFGPGPAVEICPIKIVFSEAYAARLIPGENDMPFDVWAYDTPTSEPEADFADALDQWRANEQAWAETGICEYPGFYKVVPSPWMEELAQDEEDYCHYLVAGRYASAEVIAKDWRWERLKRVENVNLLGTDTVE